MDAEAFFAAVDATLHVDAERTRAGEQCAVDFTHPRIADRFGDGVSGAFYRSGVVWHTPTRTIAFELRVPATAAGPVEEALSPLGDVGRTDHRPATTPDGEVVTVVHYSLTRDGAGEDTVATVLGALGDAVRA